MQPIGGPQGLPQWAVQQEILKRELGEFQSQFAEHRDQTQNALNQNQSTLNELLNLMRLQADARFIQLTPQVSATTTPPSLPTTQVLSSPNITLSLPAVPTTYYGSSSSTQQPQTRAQSTLNTSVPMPYIPPQTQQPNHSYAIPAPLPIRPNLRPYHATNAQAAHIPARKNPNPYPYQAPLHQPNHPPY